MGATTWCRNEDWIGAVVADDFVMMNVRTSAYVSLNETAHAIWEALESPRTQSGIEENLLSLYEVSQEECAASVSAALATMETAGLVATATAAA